MTTRPSARPWLLWLGALFVVGYLAPLGSRPLAIPDEARYAEISREMLVSGDWVAPRLVGLRYFEKPAGGYWLNSLSQLVFGHTNFAVRLASALSVGLTALLVGWMARRGSGELRLGGLAAAIYLSCAGVFGIGITAVLDSPLTLWLTAALAAFWCAFEARGRPARAGWWVVFGAACGAAFLTKGFVALAVPTVVVAPFLLWQRRWRELLAYGPLSILTAALVALPWSLAVHAREPDYWNFFFWNEHVRRFAAEDAQHAQPFWFYVPVVLALALPWTPLLPGALRAGWSRATRGQQPFARFLVCASLMPLLLFSASKGKVATYVLPCIAPLAVLLASYLRAAPTAGRERALRIAAALPAVLGAGVLVALLGGHTFFGTYQYFAGEGLRHLAVGAAFAGWLVLGLLMLRRRLGYVPGLVGLVLCVAPVQAFLQPSISQSSRAPQAWLVDVAPRFEGRDVALISMSVRLSLAMAWEFERTDIVLVGGTSELEYGIAQPDAIGRLIAPDEVPAWIASERQRRDVALFLFASPEDELGEYPVPTWSERHDTLALLVYERARD